MCFAHFYQSNNAADSEWVSRVYRPTRHHIGHFGGCRHWTDCWIITMTQLQHYDNKLLLLIWQSIDLSLCVVYYSAACDTREPIKYFNRLSLDAHLNALAKWQNARLLAPSVDWVYTPEPNFFHASGRLINFFGWGSASRIFFRLKFGWLIFRLRFG